ncbi:Uncharacterised protein [Mycobacteroides abscessus]|nr:Uncharacterised protein [Mycobacteroides abscessus]
MLTSENSELEPVSVPFSDSDADRTYTSGNAA